MISLLLITQLAFTSVDTGQFKITATSNTFSDSASVRVLPIPITRLVTSLGGSCQVFMFSDSSFVMRTFQKSDTSCVRKFELIPNVYRRTTGYYQKRVDNICILGEVLGCDVNAVFEIFKTFSTGWPECHPYVVACGTPYTTVMDYDGVEKERYENGVYWCTSRGTYGPLLPTGDCQWSGWEYPLRGFPGRWETASGWIFFTRKSN